MKSVPVVVLAGERPGGGMLGRHFGVAANALVTVAGIPTIERVVATLRKSRIVGDGLLSGPEQAVVEASPVFRRLLEAGDYRWIAPGPGPAESALAAVNCLDRWPVLMTTADHALLTSDIVESFCTLAAAKSADVVVGLAAFADVHAAFPESRRTILKFADGGRCGTNLFYLRSPASRAVLMFWQSLQNDRKRPLRMARRLGAGLLLRYVLGQLTAAQALDAIGRLAGCTVDYVKVSDPRAAVDVDSVADHALAERLLTP
jgi:GTP:adenosylcobinamide-phosphate guanylyltransferase